MIVHARYLLLPAVLGTLISGSLSCQQEQKAAPMKGLVLPLSETASVTSEEGRAVMWVVEYQDTKSAMRIETLLREIDPGGAFAFTSGTFFRSAEQGCEPLLDAIAGTLGARVDDRSAPTVDRVEFRAAITGMNLSRDPKTGFFVLTPPGDWIAMKVFVADGAGEFFMNVNPKGQLVVIDEVSPTYANVVVRELGRVLREKQ